MFDWYVIYSRIQFGLVAATPIILTRITLWRGSFHKSDSLWLASFKVAGEQSQN